MIFFIEKVSFQQNITQTSVGNVLTFYFKGLGLTDKIMMNNVCVLEVYFVYLKDFFWSEDEIKQHEVCHWR